MKSELVVNRENNMKQINLKEFCVRDDDIRGYLHEPFNFNGRTIATDGCIFISVEKQCNYDPAPKIIESHIQAILTQIQDCKEFLSIPQYELPEKNCECCNKSGLTEYCTECDGDFTVLIYSDFNEYLVDCKSCENGHDGKCYVCKGTGFKSAVAETHLGRDIYVNGATYLQQIEQLPSVEISLVNGPSGLIPFRFEGGFGCIMPLRVKRKV